ncbi:MAG: hypothetical protein RSC76_03215 [Oscillospiraceae bacterium]
MEIYSYMDFTTALLKSGFSMGGGNGNGIFSLIPWDWNQSPPYDTPVRWHTGDPETDPWEWRMRVLNERNDIAYAKLFFKKSGYITKEWYPYFLKIRRDNTSFGEKYVGGNASHEAKRIYEILEETDALPVHELKKFAGFSGEDKAKFDRGLVELQTGMFITMCGRQQKRSKTGEEYGWSSTVFCTTQRFFGKDTFEMAAQITEEEAVEKITAQIYRLNPAAEKKKILKFISG